MRFNSGFNGGFNRGFNRGLTTWIMRVGPTSLMWRWNMPLRQAVRTRCMKLFGRHGYLTAGPLIVEW